MATAGNKSGMLREVFSVDAQDFWKKFPDVTQRQIPSLTERGLYYAGQLLMRDAKMQRPYLPHKWGGLWRSEDVRQAVKKSGRWELEAGFNIEYAAALHEAPDNWTWTLEGSGPKFLEIPMAQNRDVYMAAVAQVISSGAVPSVPTSSNPS